MFTLFGLLYLLVIIKQNEDGAAEVGKVSSNVK